MKSLPLETLCAVLERPQKGLNRFPKEEHLHRQHDFERVLKEGKRFSSKLFTLIACPNNGAGRRVAFSVGKKIGKPVVRNRVKRWLREAYRTKRWALKEGSDLLFLVHPACAESSFAEVNRTMVKLMRDAKVIDESKLCRQD